MWLNKTHSGKLCLFTMKSNGFPAVINNQDEQANTFLGLTNLQIVVKLARRALRSKFIDQRYCEEQHDAQHST